MSVIRFLRPVSLLLGLGFLAASCTGTPTAPANPDDLSLLIVGGDQQSAPAGTELPLPLTVQATGPRGAALVGVVLNFHVTSGGGSVFAGSAITNRDGRASEYWTLGPVPGEPQTLEVRAVTAAGVKQVVGTFNATALPPPGATIVAHAGAEEQFVLFGDPVPIRPSIQLLDGNGNPWPGVLIVFEIVSGGGALTGDSVITNPSGIATVGSWTVGTTPGSKTMMATAQVSSVLGNPLEFYAFALETTGFSLTAGGDHTCGIAWGDDEFCWGDNQHGQLGDGTTLASLVPSLAVRRGGFAGVTVGRQHSCAIGPSGFAYCWGAGGYGQLGDGTASDHLTPTSFGPLPYIAIAAGGDHTCGVAAGRAMYCWGDNRAGQLGDGTRTQRNQPTLVPGLTRYERVAAGESHSCGLEIGGAAYCWGSNTFGQLGDGTNIDRLQPTFVVPGIAFRSLALGQNHTCGIGLDGVTYCWGSNSRGQLGDGGTADWNFPVPVAGHPDFLFISAGASHTCGMTPQGVASCWGAGTSGQLGTGDTADRRVPTPVTGGLLFNGLASGPDYTCGIALDTSGWCWGGNGFGQLGDGTTTPRLTPVPVVGGLSFRPFGSYSIARSRPSPLRAARPSR